jgi:hypothetical protein
MFKVKVMLLLPGQVLMVLIEGRLAKRLKPDTTEKRSRQFIDGPFAF